MISAGPSKIYLVTGPVQTGKTTRLRAWCDGRSEVDGILAPVVNGRRHLIRISGGEMRNLEELSGGAPAKRPRWIIVDEVGPLELSGGGLEPAVGELLVRVMEDAPLIRQDPTGVVLVIREHLVDDALKHFGVSPAAVDQFPFV